jgi:hypothetical protein
MCWTVSPLHRALPKSKRSAHKFDTQETALYRQLLAPQLVSKRSGCEGVAIVRRKGHTHDVYLFALLQGNYGKDVKASVPPQGGCRVA